MNKEQSDKHYRYKAPTRRYLKRSVNIAKSVCILRKPKATKSEVKK